MRGLTPCGHGGLCPHHPATPWRAPASGPGVVPQVIALRLVWALSVVLGNLRSSERSALALLVTRVRTNDHDPAVPADDPALVADLLDARLDLHGYLL